MRNTSYFIEILFTTGLFRMASVELATLISFFFFFFFFFYLMSVASSTLAIRNSPVVNKISMK